MFGNRACGSCHCRETIPDQLTNRLTALQVNRHTSFCRAPDRPCHQGFGAQDHVAGTLAPLAWELVLCSQRAVPPSRWEIATWFPSPSRNKLFVLVLLSCCLVSAGPALNWPGS